MSIDNGGRADRPNIKQRRKHPLFSPITAIVLAVGTVVPLIFSASYVGALHNPTPHDMPIGVVAPATMSGDLVQAINSASSNELKAVPQANVAALKAAIDKQQIYGGIVLTPPSHVPVGVVAPPLLSASLTRAIAGKSGSTLTVVPMPNNASLLTAIRAHTVYGGVELTAPSSIAIGLVAPSLVASTLVQGIESAGAGMLNVRVEPNVAALNKDLETQTVSGGILVSMPKTVPLGVVAPEPIVPLLSEQISAAGGDLFAPTIEPSAAALQKDIRSGTKSAGVIMTGPTSAQVITGSSLDYSISQVAMAFGRQLAAKQHISVTFIVLPSAGSASDAKATSFQIRTSAASDFTVSQIVTALGRQVAAKEHAVAQVIDLPAHHSGVVKNQTTVQVYTQAAADTTVSRMIAGLGGQLAAAQHAQATTMDVPLQGAGLARSLTTVQVYKAGASNFTAGNELAEFGKLFAASLHANGAVVDAEPLSKEDSTGLSSLYMMIGWVFGGYFLATVLTTVIGFKQWSRKHSLLRLGAVLLCSLASGLLGTIIAAAFGPVSSDHFWAIAGIGTLLVFSTACATAGLQAIIGMYGTQVALVAFIMLGNPSSGGIAAPEMLPGLWRAIGPWLPNAAGFTLLRNTLYYGGNNLGSAIPVLVVYAVAGAALLLAFGSSRIALYTPRVRSAVDALRP